MYEISYELVYTEIISIRFIWKCIYLYWLRYLMQRNRIKRSISQVQDVADPRLELLARRSSYSRALRQNCVEVGSSRARRRNCAKVGCISSILPPGADLVTAGCGSLPSKVASNTATSGLLPFQSTNDAARIFLADETGEDCQKSLTDEELTPLCSQTNRYIEPVLLR